MRPPYLHSRSLRLLFLLLLTVTCVNCAGAAGSTRVLFLGDSLSYGAFGKTLDTDLRKAGLTVYTQVTGGATPYYWLSDFESVSADVGHWVKTPSSERRTRTSRAVPKVETLIEKWKPEVVIVQTGTNLYAELRSKRKTEAERVRSVEYLIDRMSRVVTATGSRIYWITPPDSHESRYPRELQEQMREIMKRIGGRYGRVYDSYAVTKYTDPYPANDGIHYGSEQATAWARRIEPDLLPWVMSGRRFPIAAAALMEPSVRSGPPEPAATQPPSSPPEQEEKPGTFGDQGLTGEEADEPAEPASAAPEIRAAADLPANETAPPRTPASAGPTPAPAVVPTPPPAPPASGESVTIRRAIPVKSEANILRVDATLMERTVFEEPRRISYRNALAIYEYKIDRVIQGHATGDRIRVAHLVMQNRQMRPEKDWTPGRRVTLTLVPLSTYPDREKFETLDELSDEPGIPVYTPRL